MSASLDVPSGRLTPIVANRRSAIDCNPMDKTKPKCPFMSAALHVRLKIAHQTRKSSSDPQIAGVPAEAIPGERCRVALEIGKSSAGMSAVVRVGAHGPVQVSSTVQAPAAIHLLETLDPVSHAARHARVWWSAEARSKIECEVVHDPMMPVIGNSCQIYPICA